MRISGSHTGAGWSPDSGLWAVATPSALASVLQGPGPWALIGKRLTGMSYAQGILALAGHQVGLGLPCSGPSVAQRPSLAKFSPGVITFTETEGRVVAAREGLGRGVDGELVFKGSRVSAGEKEKVLRWTVGMVAQTVKALHATELYT